MKKQITIMLLLLALLFSSQAMTEKTKMNYTGKVSWEEIYLPVAQKFPEVESVRNDEKRHGDTVKGLLKK